MIKENSKLQLFEDQPIRTAWNEDEEEWYFAIVDVVGVLAESQDPAAYWRKLKQRLKEEGNETVTNCHGLKLKAADGKRRLTDVAITSKKATELNHVVTELIEASAGVVETKKA